MSDVEVTAPFEIEKEELGESNGPIVLSRAQAEAIAALMPKLTSTDEHEVAAAIAELQPSLENAVNAEKLERVIAWAKKRSFMAQQSELETSVEVLSTSSNATSEVGRLTVTPPTYPICGNDKVEWPNRPADGKYSLKAHFDRRISAAVAQEQHLRRGLVEALHAGRLFFELPNHDDSIRFNGWFHGALHPAAIESRLAPRQLAVFWPAFEPNAELMVNTRLLLAYKSSGGQTHFLPLNRMRNDQWEIRDFGFSAPTFSSLSSLVDYLHDVGFVELGKSEDQYEHIPVWKLKAATLDAREMAAEP